MTGGPTLTNAAIKGLSALPDFVGASSLPTELWESDNRPLSEGRLEEYRWKGRVAPEGWRMVSTYPAAEYILRAGHPGNKKILEGVGEASQKGIADGLAHVVLWDEATPVAEIQAHREWFFEQFLVLSLIHI